MVKNIYLSLFVLLFVGCGGSTSSTTTETPPTTDGQVLSPPVPAIEEGCFKTTLEANHSIPMLGILINYNNQAFVTDETTWSKKLFGKNTSEINDYYLQVSNSHFEFQQATESANCQNDGIIAVKLDKNHPDKDIFFKEDFESNVYPDLKAALYATDSTINFSNFDTDGNGHITPNELLLTFIIAGYEDAYEGYHVPNGVWAHTNCMESTTNTATLDGVSLMGCDDNGNFALFGELQDINNPHDATIGIIAHELGHSAFALPDLYNTNEEDNTGGIGIFGLMGSGSWAQSAYREYAGATPTHFSAWSKIRTGWAASQPAQQDGSVHTLNESASSSYNIIKIPINSTEYYLLENRNNSGYDRGLFALNGTFEGGMALWHIDEAKLTSYYIDYNIVNTDTDNKAVDLVEATNNVLDFQESYGDAKNLFYNPNVTNYGSIISNVSEPSSSMTLQID